MKNKEHNHVWIGADQLNNDPAFLEASQSEFKELNIIDQLGTAESSRLETTRRDFLRYLGFGIGAATLAAGCEIPVRKAIPYVVKPDSIVPGVATYFASSYVRGGDYCAIIVKTREGRPIKVEGNSYSKVTQGGTSARVQASVLSLYDTSRFDGPVRMKGGKPEVVKGGLSWDAVDMEIKGMLRADAKVRIVAPTLMSPTSRRAIEDFTAKYPNTSVVMYDAVSSSALLQANELSFGQRAVPSYQFDKASVIVGIDCDFLGTWISPIEYAAQYAKGRKVSANSPVMSRHIQVESNYSLTGSNADHRVAVRPSEVGAVIVALYNEVAKASGAATVSGPQLPADKQKKIGLVAGELLAARGKSLVVSGSNNQGEQVLVNGINNLLGNYGGTIDFANASNQRQGDDKSVRQLVKDMKSGAVDAVLVWDGANPAYELPEAADFAAAMKNVKLKVSFATQPNETSLLCDYVTPTHHYLESWGDAAPKQGHYSLLQPTIAPIFAAIGRPGTRQAEESLLLWSEATAYNKEAEQPYFDYIKAHWESAIFTKQSAFRTFQVFWDSALHDGIVEIPQAAVTVSFAADVNAAVAKVRKPSSAELEVSFFETVNMGGGDYAANPWLQEMPDPITRTTWGNYLGIPVSWDGGNEWTSLRGLNDREMYGEADIVELTLGGKKQPVTCVRQFGLPKGTLSLALGYGRETTGKMGVALGDKIGVNVYPWLKTDSDGNTQYYAADASVSDRIGVDEEFACVQYHHTMGVTARDENGAVVLDKETGKPLNVDEKTVMRLGSGYQGGLTNRSIIYHGKLNELKELTEHISHKRTEAEHLNQQTLYPYEEFSKTIYSQGHHWAMHVDLSACIGCGACQVACLAENNVPVVGKREVARHHEMTWLRIDRYYYGDYENPKAVYQPMMCQHCDNAPCENVCPVAATNHSSEGLNQMTYNRCIGTRYCANNCPYKVRRFNWLDYTTADLFGMNEPQVANEDMPFGADNLTRMVLNPDVTVRSRGVIEKCSFCVQRIQQGKLTAKSEMRSLRDADVRTACQTACPTGAIVFGDRNNKEGDIAARLENPLNYLVLEEVNTRSGVFYAARVSNTSEELDKV
jgi:MoCo/4Fe-4S cofactor protein with predicted Tat translocation signal